MHCCCITANSPCTVVIDEMIDCNLDKAADQIIVPNTYDPATRSENSLVQYPSIAFIDLEPDEDPADKKWEACGLKLVKDNLRHFIVRLYALRAPFVFINVPVDLAADCIEVMAATGNWERVSEFPINALMQDSLTLHSIVFHASIHAMSKD